MNVVKPCLSSTCFQSDVEWSTNRPDFSMTNPAVEEDEFTTQRQGEASGTLTTGDTMTLYTTPGSPHTDVLEGQNTGTRVVQIKTMPPCEPDPVPECMVSTTARTHTH